MLLSPSLNFRKIFTFAAAIESYEHVDYAVWFSSERLGISEFFPNDFSSINHEVVRKQATNEQKRIILL